jgi:xanthine dehydrogenase accessory factor
MNYIKKELYLWEFVLDSLSKHLDCVLLTVVHHMGSSPGRKGFKMVVNSSGKMLGSIGGGVMEHKLVELSKKWLAEKRLNIELKHQIHRSEAVDHRSGMICSGEQYVAMITLTGNSLNVVKSIINNLSTGLSQHILLSSGGISLAKPTHVKGFTFQSFQEWSYIESTDTHYSLHIVGGGHISLALSKLASELGFQVQLYDHREDLNTINENTFAQQVNIINYNQLGELIPAGETHLVVIMTVGYRTDMIALRQLIDNKFAYLGLLGSKAKIAQMFAELTKEGFSDELLNRIDAPAGLEISSQTPEEIAVSIGAKLIQERRTLLNKS